MEKINNKKKALMLSMLGILSLVLITVGVTYAFFNYAKVGTTDNSVTTGTITFLYTEVSGIGRGISIENAYPISDSQGKAQMGEGNVFDFKVTSKTMNYTSIPYEVTARKSTDSTLDEAAVKLYLTKVSGDSEEEVLLEKYSNLDQTTKVDSSKYIEKTIYEGQVPSNSSNYEQAFRLRMWISDDTDFSNGDMNDKTFTVTVNVYANAKVISADEEELLANANIRSLSVDNNELTLVTGQNYDYETTLPAGTTSTIVNVETENEYATVNIERIDSLVYSSNIKRLSTTKSINLVSGENYFKVGVTSENKEVTNEYKLKITVLKDTDNTLKSLSLSDCPLNETFNSNTTNYTCTIENNATITTVSAETTSSLATINILGGEELVIGENTVTITVTNENGEEKTYTIIVTKPVQAMLLSDAIFNTYTTIYENPTLTKTSEAAGENGLYKSTATNDGSPTYYFRGNVTNNYVDFAGFTWRVVRINEDGTIRLIMQNSGIGSVMSSVYNDKSYMYYSNSDTAKPTLENWYTTNIVNKGYSDKLATGGYFCEQAKVAYNSSFANYSGASMTVYSSYTPNFKCSTDANGHGIVNSSIGLITYDEAVHAGGYYDKQNQKYYLYIGKNCFTMSPMGYNSGGFSDVWQVRDVGTVHYVGVYQSGAFLRPVINLKSNITVTGSGTSDDHWKVQ